MTQEPFTVAVVQASPVFLDRDATVDKACALIDEAGRGGARLILLPESFIPTYPDWAWVLPPRDSERGSDLYAEFLEQAVTIPGPSTARLAEAARSAGACVAVGVTERNSDASSGSLYNTLIYFGPDGSLLGKHRKLMPTHAERLIWSQGDGSTLAAYDLAFGRVGGLICWENYMPLARFTVYAAGVEIYLAPTWARGDGWLATLRHIALEGRVYVLGCSIALHVDDLPDRLGLKEMYAGMPEWINVGDSAIVAPSGEIIAGPAREERERILYAQIDPREIHRAKHMFDVAGHYARPDVFDLKVNREPNPMIR